MDVFQGLLIFILLIFTLNDKDLINIKQELGNGKLRKRSSERL
jgi:hypothetical protein